jgi:hypothetical protein
MSTAFPSVEFFAALQKSLAENPSCTEGVPPSEAYCGFAIGEQLFVLEFDGRECSAVVGGGNPLDLDFVLSASAENWRQALTETAPKPLAELVAAESIRIETEADDGAELAHAALPMLQAFVDQARSLRSSG